MTSSLWKDEHIMAEHNDPKSRTDRELNYSLVGGNKRLPNDEAIIQMLSPKPNSSDKKKEGDLP